MLLGNKADLQTERQVQFEEARNYAKENDLFFMEVSALENIDDCVGKAFTTLIEEIVLL